MTSAPTLAQQLPVQTSAKARHSVTALFQNQTATATATASSSQQLPTADALFEALAMQHQETTDPTPPTPSSPSTHGPLSIHVQQLPTPRTSFSSGANSPPENLSPDHLNHQSYTRHPHQQHLLSSSSSTAHLTPTSMISAASSIVSTPSTDSPSTLASPTNNNNSHISNNSIPFIQQMTPGTAASPPTASWSTTTRASASTTISSPATKAPVSSSSHLYAQSYPSLRSTSPALGGTSSPGSALYGSSSQTSSSTYSHTHSNSNQFSSNGSSTYNMNGISSGTTFSLNQTLTSSSSLSSASYLGGSYYNEQTYPDVYQHQHQYQQQPQTHPLLTQTQEQHDLYYDELEKQKKNARSALNNVASFLPPTINHTLTKVVQQAQSVVGSGNNSKMSLPISGSTPATMTHAPSMRGTLLKLYKASKLPLLCLAWYLSSAVTNNIGKQIMNQFRYPVTLTFIQFVFVSMFCFLSGTVGLTKIRSPTVGILQMTAPLVGFQVVGHVFSSVAISHVPLSVVHTIK
ncbi:suppressor of loss of ypt1, partial [Podila epigama]